MAGGQGKPTQYKITCRFVPDIGPGTQQKALSSATRQWTDNGWADYGTNTLL